MDRHYRPLLGPTHTAEPTRGSFVPVVIHPTDRARLWEEAALFWGKDAPEIAREFADYQWFSQRKDYARTLGNWKTLGEEEAFLTSLVMAECRPSTVVVLGMGDGSAARRILDLRDYLGWDFRMVGWDGADALEHVRRDEVEMHVGPWNRDGFQSWLDHISSGVVFLDAHTYPVVRDAIGQSLAHRDWCVVIHDGSRGLCNPCMTIAREAPRVTSETGIWERHVLAEYFGVNHPLDEALDRATTPHHRLRIFPTPYGLGVIVPQPNR